MKWGWPSYLNSVRVSHVGCVLFCLFVCAATAASASTRVTRKVMRDSLCEYALGAGGAGYNFGLKPLVTKYDQISYSAQPTKTPKKTDTLPVEEAVDRNLTFLNDSIKIREKYSEALNLRIVFDKDATDYFLKLLVGPENDLLPLKATHVDEKIVKHFYDQHARFFSMQKNKAYLKYLYELSGIADDIYDLQIKSQHEELNHPGLELLNDWYYAKNVLIHRQIAREWIHHHEFNNPYFIGSEEYAEMFTEAKDAILVLKYDPKHRDFSPVYLDDPSVLDRGMMKSLREGTQNLKEYRQKIQKINSLFERDPGTYLDELPEYKQLIDEIYKEYFGHTPGDDGVNEAGEFYYN